ncbi:MAG TPA: SpvB/TcaC N-terminal domain-containing protein, partial [Azonexus sp.]|nr:SpvB/TcaC N-terminal domain-containing protein [Azonexus sp.]
MQQQAQASAGEQKDTFRVTAPAISLPKGGGAIRGIGEKFAANPVTGTGSLSVPIATSPGRNGFGPQLALSYDSGAGNGPFGLGWQLGLLAITRKTDKGLPRYLDEDESDVFILAGAEDLVPVSGSDGQPLTQTRTVHGALYRVRTYRPRCEGLFARIERWVQAGRPDNMFWRTLSRDNVTTWFGKSADSRLVDAGDATRIYSWLVCETHDDKGNVATYHYTRDDAANVDTSSVEEANRSGPQRSANCYTDRIRYGNVKPYLPTLAASGQFWPGPNDVAAQHWMFEVVFDYSAPGNASPPTAAPANTADWAVRPDPFSTHRAGFELRTYRLCRRVLMFHHFTAELGAADYLVRSTDFEYQKPAALADPAQPGYTVLNSVSQRAYQKRNATDTDYEARCWPPVSFTYSQPRVDSTIHAIAADQLENLPVGIQGPGYQWLDLDGEGLSGVLTEQAGGWVYKPNRGAGQFGPQRAVAPPALALAAGSRHRFMDLDGSGAIDVVDFDRPTPGFHERDGDAGWKQHVPFASLPNIDWQDANLRFVDLTGDGHADALITESEVFTWYPSLDKRGFAASARTHLASDENAGPRLVFAETTQTIFLADMCGDGLTDLVRIRNGEVCYWPNLGYGRFGRKITLSNAPRFDSPDMFDPSRIRLADIDGSGPIDLIYLGRDGARLYFNRSGNSFSDGQPVALPVATENLGAVQVADLLGNGTACLVWNSHLPADAGHAVRYVDLMAGVRNSDADREAQRKHEKPHLLIKV